MNRFIILIILAFCGNVNAAKTYTYCAKTDGSDWDWLISQSGSYVMIEGEWGREYISDNEFFTYFNVSEERYQYVNEQCGSELATQPADRGTDKWEVFRVTQPSGSHYTEVA